MDSVKTPKVPQWLIKADSSLVWISLIILLVTVAIVIYSRGSVT